jgi:hypothetical protein
MFFFLFVVFFAIFFNSSLSNFFGINEVFTFAFLPIMMLIAYEAITGNLNYSAAKNKQARRLIVVGVIILFFKLLIDHNDPIYKSVIQLLIVPALLLIFLNRLTLSKNKILYKTMLFFFVIECSLALYERIMMIHIFYYDKGLDSTEDWAFRSRSLLGDPLNNAMIVTTILSFILSSNRVKTINKIIFFVLGYISLFCFNARGAIIVSTVIMLPYLLFKTSQQRLFKENKAASIISIFIFFGLLFILIFSSDLGGRIVHNDKLIDGSAQTRLKVFEFSRYIDTMDLFIGNSGNTLLLMKKLGAGGIENGVIAMIIYYGIIFTIPILLLLFFFQYDMLKKYTRFERCLILAVFYLIGLMNPNLIHPEQWIIFIFSYFAFRSFPYLDDQKFSKKIKLNFHNYK